MKTYTNFQIHEGEYPGGYTTEEWAHKSVAEGLLEALKVIAESDVLFEQNPGAFGATAFRRVQLTASAAIAAAEEE
jgi:hypothetical protein